MNTEGFADFHGHRIWYRATGPDTRESAVPLLLLHGGPGAGSDIFEPLEAMAQRQTVIRFDQLGCGRSDRPRDPSLWTISSCMQQLASVRNALGLDRVHLLGHSWGGMVALEYLLTGPSGVRSACLCSPVVSVRLWVDEALRLRSLMPAHIAMALDRCERSYRPRKPPEPGARPARALTQGKIDRRARAMQAVFPLIAHPVSARIASVLSWIPALRGAVYEILGAQFVQRHVCRLRPAPLGLFRMLAGMNREIYETLWGPSEFFAPGLLKNWDIRPRLAQIRVPTLIVSGRHDEATPAQMAILHQGIADSQWIVLQKSAHCAMWEEPDEFRAALLGFLDRVEATIGP